MEITEVKMFMRNATEGKLKAYATITLDSCFIIRDLKVIEGKKGLFVAMPSRKLRQACSKCRHPNAIGSKFCNACGATISFRPQRENAGFGENSEGVRQETHKDIAHPITVETRDYIQKKVMGAYENEGRSSVPIG